MNTLFFLTCRDNYFFQNPISAGFFSLRYGGLLVQK